MRIGKLTTLAWPYWVDWAVKPQHKQTKPSWTMGVFQSPGIKKHPLPTIRRNVIDKRQINPKFLYTTFKVSIGILPATALVGAAQVESQRRCNIMTLQRRFANVCLLGKVNIPIPLSLSTFSQPVSHCISTGYTIWFDCRYEENIIFP